MSNTRITAQPLAQLEKAIPAPALFLADILRLALCLVGPILFYRLGERAACYCSGAYAEEIIGATLLLDGAAVLLYWLPRVKRWGRRLLAWCLSEAPLGSYGRQS